ncbi:MAG: DUF72 domain-containing protein [Verrucomicrobiota bacterium]
MANKLPYAIGCPAWSIPEWRGKFLPQSTPQSKLLREYSRVFNTVEGNSFFYALPQEEIVQRWADESAEGFEFCMKVPRDLSHTNRLSASGPIFESLIRRLDILREAIRLGTTFLQLHASFGPSRLEELGEFLDGWPDRLPIAVEVRNEAFFQPGRSRSDLYALLRGRECDRVTFDSRALFSAPPSDPVEEKSQERKPRLPVEWTVTGKRPLVRFVGRNNINLVDPWQSEVARVVAHWIREGRRPYVFMHTPDDTFAPQLCRRFHCLLQEWIPDLPDLQFPQVESQLGLFDLL